MSLIIMEDQVKAIELSIELSGTIVKHTIELTGVSHDDLKWAIAHGRETASILATAIKSRKRVEAVVKAVGLLDIHVSGGDEVVSLNTVNVFGSSNRKAYEGPGSWKIIDDRREIRGKLKQGSESPFESFQLEVGEVTSEARISKILDSLIIHGAELETVSIRLAEFMGLCRENRDFILGCGKTVFVFLRTGEKVDPHRRNLYYAMFYPGFSYLEFGQADSLTSRETKGAYVLLGKKN